MGPIIPASMAIGTIIPILALQLRLVQRHLWPQLLLPKLMKTVMSTNITMAMAAATTQSLRAFTRPKDVSLVKADME